MSKVLIKFKNHMTFKNKKISLLGFGAWGLGGDAYGEISNQKSLNLLKYSIANGVNFIDTSNIYGKGLSEKRIGLLLLKNKKIRPKLFVATKCGTKNHSPSSWIMPQNFKVSYLKKSIEQSLKRLNTSYVDLIQLHSPPLKLLKNKKEIKKILNLFIELKKKKKIKYFGISTKSPEDALFVLKNYKSFKFIQLNFNLIDQRALDCGALDLAQKKGVSMIARTPLAFGYLAGKVNIKGKDHRKKWSKKQKDLWSKGRLEFTKVINRKNINSTILALLFATYHPAIKTAIPGMMKIKDVKENLKFLNSKKLTKKEVRKLIFFYKKNQWVA